MKISDKTHYNDFLYGLIYPGFIGTMIVDILPDQLDRSNFGALYSLENFCKISITLFYCLDFLHLYADMNPKIKVEDRKWDYIICDFLSSIVLFTAFLSMKWHHQHWGMLLLSFLPLIVFFYKKKNKADQNFFAPYIVVSFIIGTGLFLKIYLAEKIDTIASTNYLLAFSLFLLVIYGIYVFFYYNKYSSKLNY